MREQQPAGSTRRRRRDAELPIVESRERITDDLIVRITDDIQVREVDY